MPVTCYETEYKNFGRCVALENGKIKLMATIDVGPRIIYFGTCGNDNILFEDIDRDFFEIHRGSGIWYAYGGHRLWSAPEQMPETYLPDNDTVAYRFEGSRLTLTPKMTESEKQFELILEMSEDNTVHITNKITNLAQKPQRFAAWSVTGFASGGIELVPLSRENMGFLPNRTMSLWSYASLSDPRLCLTDTYATLRHDPANTNAFKAGFNVTDGYVLYAAGNQLFKKTFADYEKINYPDFCCNFETYTNQHFLECELLGEERSYQPGEAAILCESWEITETGQQPESVIASYLN